LGCGGGAAAGGLRGGGAAADAGLLPAGGALWLPEASTRIDFAHSRQLTVVPRTSSSSNM
jgi:hypothetical protein